MPIEELKNVYNDLHNAAHKLTKISANTDNKELFLKLCKITNEVLQTMYELNDNVIEPIGVKNENN